MVTMKAQMARNVKVIYSCPKCMFPNKAAPIVNIKERWLE